MIIIKLQGGLGNQMFQYAMARSMANEKEIYFDFSFLKQNNVSTDNFTARNFELNIFKNLLIQQVNPYLRKLILSKRKLARLIAPKYKIITDENILDYRHSTDYKICYLDGYFQNPSLFKSIRSKILSNFKFPSVPNELKSVGDDIEKEQNSIAIHIRRGDYLKPDINNFHGLLTMDYYKKAIEIIKSKVENPFFFIFSDDTEWCENNLYFIKSKRIVQGEHPAWADMLLMAKCKHQIIANSSFSWWAAWLNDNVEKTIIAPKKWFSDQETNIIPEEWISL